MLHCAFFCLGRIDRGRSHFGEKSRECLNPETGGNGWLIGLRKKQWGVGTVLFQNETRQYFGVNSALNRIDS